jgi:hypothetical protein
MKMLTGNGDTVVVYSTTTRYFWLTGWVRCHGVTTADFVFFTKVADDGDQFYRASVPL